MRVGTKSVLFGAHAFYLHPWFVAWAWTKLYGFPWDPRLWVAFFVHDLGYWGCPNMDGDEGERHPEWGARVMTALFDPLWKGRTKIMPGGEDEWGPDLGRWGQFVLYHSRFYAKRYRQQPSRLCIADKLAICLTWRWLYLPMVTATGEILEYMRDYQLSNPGEPAHGGDRREWHRNMTAYMRRWVEEHKDGRDDKADGSGVWE